MKLRIENENRPALADVVAWVAKNLPNRPSVPVLAGVMLCADDTGLHVSGFDYEVSTQATVPVAAGGEDGAALVSGRLLAEIVKALPAKAVDIQTVGTHLELVCGSARFTLPTMPVEDYPALPEMPESTGTVDASVFANAVARVAVAAGTDDTLPMMTGIRVELAGTTMALLATDRYRLAVREIQWAPGDPAFTANLLVPAKTLAAAVKVIGRTGDVSLSVASAGQGEGMVGLSADGRQMTSRLLDGGNYPPVRSLFPKEITSTAVVSVAALTEVVKRVALVAERTTPVILAFSPAAGLLAEAGGTEDARASEDMEVQFTGTEQLTIAFNPQYLLDGLAAAGTPQALFSFVDGIKPAVISPCDEDGQPDHGYRYLIMPIRVSR